MKVLALAHLLSQSVANARELLVVTVATEKTDGYLRWEESVKYSGLKSKTFGLGEDWLGGDIANGPGGGHKVNLLKKELAEYEGNKDLYFLFTDAYDVIITGKEEEIFSRFDEIAGKVDYKTNVLISAEDLIWPDRSLEPKYPLVLGKRFLCSGAILARADIFLQLLDFRSIGDRDDDQLFYTEAYIDKELREKYGIALDHKAELFFNLNGALEEVGIDFARTADGDNRVENTKYRTKPLVIHGNGPSKNELNRINATDTNRDIVLAFIIDGITPFVHNALKRIASIDYPAENTHLLIYSNTAWADERVETFLEAFGSSYKSTKFISSKENMSSIMARKFALQLTEDKSAEFAFFVDGYVQLTNAAVVGELMKTGLELVAPGMSRYGKLWSNYWGAVASDGYYSRSDDYLDIVQGTRVGIWNMPFVNGAYLMHKNLALDLLDMFAGLAQSPWRGNFKDPDLDFSANLRTLGIFMHVSNQAYWGRLVDKEHLPVDRLHPELWQPEWNRPDWEEDYLDSDYWRVLEPETEMEEPCPDVVAFPFLTSKGGFDMIEEMEHYGKWSGGNDAHKDDRLSGGYENVPTVDIHMNQIGLHDEWLYVVKTYAAPMVSKFYTGYSPDNKPNLMFVVRYKPGEQDRLRPHHDSSTWTFQIALNRPNVDFEGGDKITHWSLVSKQFEEATTDVKKLKEELKKLKEEVKKATADQNSMKDELATACDAIGVAVPSERSSCKVCLETYNGKDHQECTLQCGHRSCFKCLAGLFQKFCPVCRAAFKDDQIIKLYQN
ncbi:Oidioi.mRNA.OKI2018_I69.PAR.g12045.t1.cds [Oikopleura dioica]|uniref:Oidioi.mRNA.OKI2018_I69.PAR.g12045.t1.cds n=1 Tax=Oikopleura dioica TaxID=34765 RepID=A0ABN7S2X3_OIKDI|nr:Oidioi.mRNA.OKI2018_I69.PAR.g12045.t1.cds [Oikopleura dioica]